MHFTVFEGCCSSLVVDAHKNHLYTAELVCQQEMLRVFKRTNAKFLISRSHAYCSAKLCFFMLGRSFV